MVETLVDQLSQRWGDSTAGEADKTQRREVVARIEQMGVTARGQMRGSGKDATGAVAGDGGDQVGR